LDRLLPLSNPEFSVLDQTQLQQLHLLLLRRLEYFSSGPLQALHHHSELQLQLPHRAALELQLQFLLRVGLDHKLQFLRVDLVFRSRLQLKADLEFLLQLLPRVDSVQVLAPPLLPSDSEPLKLQLLADSTLGELNLLLLHLHFPLVEEHRLL
jgi:hypothetical protein